MIINAMKAKIPNSHNLRYFNLKKSPAGILRLHSHLFVIQFLSVPIGTLAFLLFFDTMMGPSPSDM